MLGRRFRQMVRRACVEWEARHRAREDELWSRFREQDARLAQRLAADREARESLFGGGAA